MKYRKKPRIVEAHQWDGTAAGATPIIDWVLAGDGVATYNEGHRSLINPEQVFACGISIRTLEGTMVASENDYVICGVAGEFYPCKPDIFHDSYEPLADE